MSILFYIDAGHFYAGGTLEHGFVTRAAPIIKYMIGWDARRLFSYCKGKGYDCRLRECDSPNCKTIENPSPESD